MDMSHIPLRLLLFVLIAQLIFSCFPILLFAQSSVPIPSVPEFTINVTDATNGKFEIILVIKNQQYNEKINGFNTDFSYHGRAKGHFSEEWSQAPWVSVSGISSDGSGYAKMIIPSERYPAGGIVDFQVEAILTGNGGTSFGDWVEQHSGWSSTQTVTIPSTTFPTSNSPSATPIADPFGHSTQTATDNPQPDSGDNWNQMSIALTVIGVIVIVDGIALAIFLVNKHKKNIKNAES